MIRRRTHRTSPNEQKATAVILLILTLIYAVYTIVVTIPRNKYLDKVCTSEAIGTITSIHRRRRSSYMYVTYRANSKSYKIKSTPEIGEKKDLKVIVHYNPKNPDEAYIGEKAGSRSHPIITIIIFVAISLVMLVTSVIKE